jgi:large repetitive protein
VLLENAERNEVTALQIGGQCGFSVRSSAIVFSRSDRNRARDVEVSGGEPAILFADSDRNTIEDGRVEGGINPYTGDAILLGAGSDGNRLADLSIGSETTGIGIGDSRRNVLEGSRVYGEQGNYVSGERTVISRNTFGGGQSVALSLSGNDNLFTNNVVASGEAGGIWLSGNRNLIYRNTAYVGIDLRSGSENVIRANTVPGDLGTHYFPDADGLRVGANATSSVVEDNLVNDAYDDGIDVEAPGTLIRKNVANDNGDLGIEAVEGVIDGGGNGASGNGNPLQCVNVFCK